MPRRNPSTGTATTAPPHIQPHAQKRQVLEAALSQSRTRRCGREPGSRAWGRRVTEMLVVVVGAQVPILLWASHCQAQPGGTGRDSKESGQGVQATMQWGLGLGRDLP